MVLATLAAAAPRGVCAQQWAEARATHYSVFYQPGFEQDSKFARTWLDAAEVLMKTKYGVSPDNYRLAVYLDPIPIAIGHYAVQDARPNGGWSYIAAPRWFVQGLREFDGIFHTTDDNRRTTVARLMAQAPRISANLTCCSSDLGIDDIYNGGALFLAFLAESFDEDIHARLIRSAAPSFEAALANETRPWTYPELVERFRAWLNSGAAISVPSLPAR